MTDTSNIDALNLAARFDPKPRSSGIVGEPHQATQEERDGARDAHDCWKLLVEHKYPWEP